MLNIIGITISFVGSILLAFSIKKNPGAAHQVVNGKKRYLTIIYLGLFRFGIGFLALGFALQFIGIVFRC